MLELIAGIKIIFAFILIPLFIASLVIIVGTAINFLPSFYLARYFRNFSPHCKRSIFVIVFVLSSITLHLNYRIPGILEDFLDRPTESSKINQRINVFIGTPISVEINHDSIRYKPKYLESTWLGGYFYSFRNLNLKSDYFISHLESTGVRIQRNTKSAIKITGVVEKNDTHHSIRIKVVQNEKTVAEYANKYRVSFAGEQSSNTLTQLALTLLQSTPTRLLFPDYWRNDEYAGHTVTNFLDQVFHVSVKPETLSVTEYTVKHFVKYPVNYLTEKDELLLQRNFCMNGIRVRLDRRWVEV